MSARLQAIVIEDDFLLAEALTDGLATLGCEVLARAANVRDGLRIAESVSCDFAVVDLSLHGEPATPVLDWLDDHRIPFLMATAAFVDDIPPRHMDAARLSKPYDMRELRQAIDRLSLGANFAPQD